MLDKTILAPWLGVPVINRRSCVEENIASEISHLEPFVQIVRFAEALEDVIESVQQGYPVIKISTGEGPS